MRQVRWTTRKIKENKFILLLALITSAFGVMIGQGCASALAPVTVDVHIYDVFRGNEVVKTGEVWQLYNSQWYRIEATASRGTVGEPLLPERAQKGPQGFQIARVSQDPQVVETYTILLLVSYDGASITKEVKVEILAPMP